jgi:hypothetical protein
VLQKIEHVCRSISLNDQGHSPRSRGEGLLQQLYAYDRLRYEIQHIKAWSSINSHHRHRLKEQKENLHTIRYKAKLK